jgi:hypothetical protein
LENNRQDIAKDDEFRIERSMKDIVKIEEEVKNIKRSQEHFTIEIPSPYLRQSSIHVFFVTQNFILLHLNVMFFFGM